MAILQQLGLNDTFFLQFLVFAIAYYALSSAFAGYTKAKEERDNQTKGGETLAVEIAQKTADLKTEYERKARDISGKIKAIFDEQRSAALREYDFIVSKAKEDAQKTTELSRAKIESEFSSAKAQLTDHVPQVAGAITNKLLVKQ